MFEHPFKIGQRVKLRASTETGEVIGVAVWAHAEPSACVRYRAGDGRVVEVWWTVGAIEPAPGSESA